MFAPLVFVVAALGVVAAATGSKPSAPLLIWGSSNHNSHAYALHQFGDNELNNILAENRKPDAPTVVFHVPTLDTLDLSKYKKSLPSLQSLTSLYLPQVAEPVSTLQSFAGASALRTDDSAAAADISATIAAARPGDYVFVGLTSADNEPRADTLRRHDALIHAINADLAAQHKDALFVFTGQPSASASAAHRVARQAPAPIDTPAAIAPPQDKQAEANPDEISATFVREHLLLHYTSLKYAEATVNIASIVVGEPVTVGDEQQISVQLVAVPPTDSVSFNVSGAHGYWEVDAFEFRGETLRPLEHSVAALVGFSFHCTPSLNFQSTTGVLSQLHLQGLQLEPIFEKDANQTEFSDAWDCVGFTSAGIWGGLFVTFLMLIILSIGISWIMDIHTMDRFDDPKGKTIIVSAAE